MTTKAVKKTTTKKQRLWPASRANIWTVCTASENNSLSNSAKNYFAEPDSFLQNNSLMHELSSKLFDSKISLSIEAEQLDQKADPDVESYLDILSDFVHISMGESPDKEIKFLVEQTFQNDKFLAIPDLIVQNFATRQILIYDFKFGFNPVDAENNLQLLLGFHLFVDSLSLLTKKILVKEKFTFSGAIVQPTLNSISMVELFYDSQFYNKLKEKIKKPFFRVGYHCRYCNAKTTCKKLAESITSFLKPLPVKDLKNRKQVWAELLQIAPAVKSLAEEIQKEAKNYLSLGGPLPGWNLGKKPLRRLWLPGMEDKFLAKSLGLSLVQLTNQKRKSPAQVEKVLGKNKKEKISEFISQPYTDSLEIDKQ